jgi:hypothetical protein
MIGIAFQKKAFVPHSLFEQRVFDFVVRLRAKELSAAPPA